MRRVCVSIRVSGGVPREELPHSGDHRLGPLVVLRTQQGLGTGGVAAELDVGVRNASHSDADEDLSAIESAVAIVRAEVDKRGWKLDGASAQIQVRPKWAP